MKRIRMALASTLLIILFIHAGLSLAQPERANISGTVTFDDTEVCAMILANGQHMFSCGDSPGLYDLEVPLDENGQITLFSFASGFTPYKEVLTPSGNVATRNIQMTRSDSARLPQVLLVSKYPSEEYPNRIYIQGYIMFNEEPVCSMVLVNGQSMFTCDGTGLFELDIPLDEDGNITFFCFISGFSPYKIVFDNDTVNSPVILDPVVIPLNQRLLGEWRFEYTTTTAFERTYLLPRISQVPSGFNVDITSYIRGTDEYGDLVFAYNIPMTDWYGLEDQENEEILNYFQFYFFDDDTVIGQYFEYYLDTGESGEAYPMMGSKLADL